MAQPSHLMLGLRFLLLVLLVVVVAVAATPAVERSIFSTSRSRSSRLRNRARSTPPPVHVPLHAPASYQAAAPVMAQCQELYHEQPVDHFAYHRERSPAGRTFRQRFFVCAKDWWQGNGSPIFFYCGNEANVELYLNATGLMWENAEAFGALIVFAEHRCVRACMNSWIMGDCG